MEILLAGFLTGARGLELKDRLTNIKELPPACRPYLQEAEAKGCMWAAWSTPGGPVAVWGDYDMLGSKHIQANLLFVEWWFMPGGHRALWCYSRPNRPTEWVIGRGRPSDAP